MEASRPERGQLTFLVTSSAMPRVTLESRREAMAFAVQSLPTSSIRGPSSHLGRLRSAGRTVALDRLLQYPAAPLEPRRAHARLGKRDGEHGGLTTRRRELIWAANCPKRWDHLNLRVDTLDKLTLTEIPSVILDDYVEISSERSQIDIRLATALRHMARKGGSARQPGNAIKYEHVAS